MNQNYVSSRSAVNSARDSKKEGNFIKEDFNTKYIATG